MDERSMQDKLAKLREYEELEEKGLLIKLPCPVGTPLYEIVKLKDTDSIKYRKAGKIYKFKFGYGHIDKIGRIGIDIFYTEDEAVRYICELGKRRTEQTQERINDSIQVGSRVSSELYGCGTVEEIAEDESGKWDKKIVIRFFDDKHTDPEIKTFYLPLAFTSGTIKVIKD